MKMTTYFEVQDPLLIFDMDASMLLLDDEGESLRELLAADFDAFLQALSEQCPKSNTSRYFEACHNIEGAETKGTLVDLARSGFAPSSFLLSYLYEHGEFGFTRNETLERAYLRQAIALGHAHAFWIYGSYPEHRNTGLGKRSIIASACLGFTPAIDHISESEYFKEYHHIVYICEKIYGF